MAIVAGFIACEMAFDGFVHVLGNLRLSVKSCLIWEEVDARGMKHWRSFVAVGVLTIFADMHIVTLLAQTKDRQFLRFSHRIERLSSSLVWWEVDISDINFGGKFLRLPLPFHFEPPT